MVDREDRREDVAASTAMFKAYVQRRDADSSTEKKSRGAGIWIVAAVAIVAVVAIIAALLS